MRNISFALTTEQVRARTKTVTRRLGWKTAKAGDLLQPVLRAQGLNKGERVQKLGGPIRVVSVRRERLGAITRADVVREGFPSMTVAEFIEMFGRSHRIREITAGRKHLRMTRPCGPDDEVTRIEFAYVEER